MPSVTVLAWPIAAVATGAVIAVMPPRTALALVLAAVVVLMSIWRPSAGLGLLVASVPIQDAWPAMAGTISFTWTRLILICVVTGWFCGVCLKRRRLDVTPIGWAQAAMLLVLIASIWNARDVGAWAEEVYRWAIAALIFVLSLNSLHDRRDRWNVVAGIAAGIILSSCVAAYQLLTGTGPATFASRGVIRAYGLFGEPNPFAAYLAMASLPLLSLGLFELRAGAKPAAAALLGTGGVGALTLLFTQSRGGLLGFCAGAAVIVWMHWPQTGRLLVVAIGAVGLAVVISPLGAPIRATFGFDNLARTGPVHVTPATFSAQERLAHWCAAISMWREHPIIGIGAGNFVNQYREHTPVWRFRISRGHAHSAYLQAAAQAGLAGFAAYVLLLATVVRRLARRRSNDPLSSGLVVGGLAVTATVAVHGLFEYVHVLSLGIVLSAVWALADKQPARAGE